MDLFDFLIYSYNLKFLRDANFGVWLFLIYFGMDFPKYISYFLRSPC